MSKKKYGGKRYDIISDTGGTVVDSKYMPWIRLAAAILKQASRDYMAAIISNEAGNIRKYEDFFISEYGQTLSFHQGEYIINQVRKEAAGKTVLPRKNASKRHKS